MPYDDFYKEFSPFLSLSPRWPIFCEIAKVLYALERPVNILETGCLREPGNWLGDGNSTRLWAYIAESTGGKAVSVDIDRKATERAVKVCPTVKFIPADSIKVLAMAPDLEKIDLVYLDSYDHTPPYPLSMLHHVGELAAVWERLQLGCLIAIDDCLSEIEGKHVYVQRFMDDMTVPMIADGYVKVWQKT